MNNWQDIADPTFLNKLMLIDWQAIVLRLVSSNKGRKFTFFQAIVAIRQYGLFLYLIKKYPHTKMVPNQEIDAALHAHQNNVLL
jgi:hypothetical protein